MNAPTPTDAQRRSRRLRRCVATFGFVLGTIIVASGCLPLPLPAVMVPATSGRTYGQGPLDAIREAANRTTTMKRSGTEQADPNFNCGLSSVDLAAMMIVPTYFEAGGTLPSPMTLSRWDNTSGGRVSNAKLFAFGRTSGAYVNAFFSPGIGLWQFDSAGRWDLTAAEAINATSAANQASLTIAYRWCTAPASKLASPQLRRQYAWGPWYGCSFGNSTSCEDTFKQLVTSDGKLNTSFDAAVSRTGGMQQRTCNLRGIGDGLTCFYINPALAEGSRGWQGGTYDGSGNSVTPLPKPFYSVRANGNEYRVWLKEDTGYDINITASKQVTADARAPSALTWTPSTVLCDTSTRRGFCGNVNPEGSFDAVTQDQAGKVRVAGWAFDGDTTDPIQVHIYVGAVGTAITANGTRTDVGLAYPGMGDNHGFIAEVPAPTGNQTVCAYGINVGGGTTNVLLGCKNIFVTGAPNGNIDLVTIAPGSFTMTGWVMVPGNNSPKAIVSVDGTVVGSVARTIPRDDVLRKYPTAGRLSGFSGTCPSSGGVHRVCLTSGFGTIEELGCRTISLPTGVPKGALGEVTAKPGSVTVSGWALDPDTVSPIAVHVYLGSSGTALTANTSRPGVASYYPAYGALHGFDAVIPASAATLGATVNVCAYGIDTTGAENTLLGCKSVSLPTGAPFGSADAIVRTADGVYVAGWAIDPDTSAPASVHIYVGATGTALTANGERTDVGRAYPLYGNNHGFAATLAIGPLPKTVCVYAIESAGTGSNRLLACQTV